MNQQYLDFTNELRRSHPDIELSTDKFLNQTFGTDASFYRLVPKIVIHTHNESEVKTIINLASQYMLPITFRAAGTSLSGQAISDSILVVASHNWKQFSIIDNAEKIKLQPGLIGEAVNKILSPYGKKIGPDPASISSCMIGGIINNNSSGMCCGIEQNSYQTINSARVIFADGTLLDTSDKQSKMSFVETHPKFIVELKRLAAEVKNNPSLANRIAEKYKIKNTTGYSINALLDFTDPFDILLHLIVGSEGTLAFLSEVVLKTVVNYDFKATTLVCFKDLFDACKAVEEFRKHPNLVAAAELMDRVSVRSVEDISGAPDYLKSLPEETVCLLVEAQTTNQNELDDKVEKITSIIDNFTLIRDYKFTQDKANYDSYWKIRKGVLPSVGAARKAGASIITEDFSFPIDKLVQGTIATRKLLDSYGYNEAGIVGHALASNLHFIFTPNIDDKKQIEDYDNFMIDFTNLIVDDFNGSLKGEHGTGRNIAPFVEKEWGETAYQIMQSIKKLFDPNRILNPEVIISDNKKLHIENLKPIPMISSLVDKCMECGFCEDVCPSKRFSLTPRQRITMARNMSTLSKLEQEKAEKLFDYYGDKTCAASGLCAERCPVGINTGDFIKELRSSKQTNFNKNIAEKIADNYSFAIQTNRLLLTVFDKSKQLFGAKFMKASNNFLAKIIPIIPKYNPALPKAGSLLSSITKLRNSVASEKSTKNKLVYFPSCGNRMLGDNNEMTISQAFYAVCERANYQIIAADDNNLCCGMVFDSKGFSEPSHKKQSELEKALLNLTNDGQHPVVMDASSCMYHSISHFSEETMQKLKIYDFVSFAHDHLLETININPELGKYAFHVTCSSQKNGDTEKFKLLANKLVEQAAFPENVSCCGFAGDKGFFTPELNASALSEIKPEIVGCKSGYSNNKPCEIGLSKNSGIGYESIIYLLEKVTR